MDGDSAPPRTPRGKWLQQLVLLSSESDDKIRSALKAFISAPRPALPATALRDGLIVPGFDVVAYWKQHAITNEPFFARLRDALIGAICELDASEFFRGNIYRLHVVWEPWPLWRWNGRQRKGCFRLAELNEKNRMSLASGPESNWHLTRYGFALAQSYPDHPFCGDATPFLAEFAQLLPGQLSPWDVPFLRNIIGATSAFLSRVSELASAADDPKSGKQRKGGRGRRYNYGVLRDVVEQAAFDFPAARKLYRKQFPKCRATLKEFREAFRRASAQNEPTSHET